VDTVVRLPYIVATVVLVVVGLILGPIIASASTVAQNQVEGIAAFAILYVLAQAIERANQVLVPVFDRLVAAVSKEPTATTKKQRGLTVLRAQAAAARGVAVGVFSADTQTEGAKTVTTADIEKALLTNGLAFLLAMLLVGLFKFSLLASLGYADVPALVDLILTATAIMGGASGLSDLVSKVQKTKTAAETSA
jgi:hypothetical protein